jgi:hypothetical protein
METRAVCAVAPSCWKYPEAVSSSFKCPLKGQRISAQWRSELIVSSKNMGPIIRFRDMAHHTPNIVSFISCGLVAGQTRLFWPLTWWGKWIHASSVRNMTSRMPSPSAVITPLNHIQHAWRPFLSVHAWILSCRDAGANTSSALYVCCHSRCPSAVPIYEH